ncbi:hypothetical protein JNL27_14095 [bacterium]|nr:hypothetical protein [bacterium]
MPVDIVLYFRSSLSQDKLVEVLRDEANISFEKTDDEEDWYDAKFLTFLFTFRNEKEEEEIKNPDEMWQLISRCNYSIGSRDQRKQFGDIQAQTLALIGYFLMDMEYIEEGGLVHDWNYLLSHYVKKQIPNSDGIRWYDLVSDTFLSMPEHLLDIAAYPYMVQSERRQEQHTAAILDRLAYRVTFKQRFKYDEKTMYVSSDGKEFQAYVFYVSKKDNGYIDINPRLGSYTFYPFEENDRLVILYLKNNVSDEELAWELLSWNYEGFKRYNPVLIIREKPEGPQAYRLKVWEDEALLKQLLYNYTFNHGPRAQETRVVAAALYKADIEYRLDIRRPFEPPDPEEITHERLSVDFGSGLERVNIFTPIWYHDEKELELEDIMGWFDHEKSVLQERPTVLYLGNVKLKTELLEQTILKWLERENIYDIDLLLLRDYYEYKYNKYSSDASFPYRVETHWITRKNKSGK